GSETQRTAKQWTGAPFSRRRAAARAGGRDRGSHCAAAGLVRAAYEPGGAADEAGYRRGLRPTTSAWAARLTRPDPHVPRARRCATRRRVPAAVPDAVGLQAADGLAPAPRLPRGHAPPGLSLLACRHRAAAKAGRALVRRR